MDESKTNNDECLAENQMSTQVQDSSDINYNESKEDVDESRVENDESRVENDESRVENDGSKLERVESSVMNNETPDNIDNSKVEKDEPVDKLDAMDKLLDSALQDFDKRAPKKSKVKPAESSKSSEDDLLDMFHKAGFPQGASMRDINEQLHNLSLMNQNSASSLNSSYKAESSSFTQSLASSSSSLSFPGASSSLPQDLKSLAGGQAGNFDSLQEQDGLGGLHEALLKLGQDSAKLNELPTDEEMEKMFQGMSTDNLEKDLGNLLPMMNGMMQSLLSKELLYPAIKDMSDEYPTWLINNKQKLQQQEYDKYEQQSFITKKICLEFEKEENGSPEEKTETFNRVLALMEEMQKLGNPPKDLVGSADLPSLPSMGGQEQCTIS